MCVYVDVACSSPVFDVDDELAITHSGFQKGNETMYVSSTCSQPINCRVRNRHQSRVCVGIL